MFSVLKRDADTKTSPKRRWSAFCLPPLKDRKALQDIEFFFESHRDTLQNLNMCVAVPCSKNALI